MEQYTDQLQVMLAFSASLALVVVPSLAALKAHIPQLEGWKTLVAAFALSFCITGLLVQPVTFAAAMSGILSSILTTFLSVGGDSYLTRLLDRAKKTQ